MRGRLARCLVALLAVTALFAAPAAIAVAGTAGDAGETTDPGIAQVDDVDPDEVRMELDLDENESATWEVQFWVRLSNEEEIQAFEDLQADVADDPSNYTDRFAERIDATVATAADATGRGMSAGEYAVRTDRQSLAREYGVLTYTFRWTGFAAVAGAELHAGDAIEGYNLDDRTRLTITWPEAYELVSVAPDPDDSRDRSVVWRGSETDFLSGEPALVVSTDGGTIPGYALATAFGAVVVVGATAAWWLWFRRRPSTDGTGADERSSSGEAPSSPDAGPTTDSPADDPAEFLSNEERVLRLLEARGGRMKQQEVVSELGWTDAKTSQVVTGLREDGELESFRLGRENVLTLPEEDET